jgi:hypothetical protein
VLRARIQSKPRRYSSDPSRSPHLARIPPDQVLQDPLFRDTVMNVRENAAAAMRNLLGHPDNCNFVTSRGTGLRQWPDLLQGATGLLVNHQRCAGNVVTIDPLPQVKHPAVLDAVFHPTQQIGLQAARSTRRCVHSQQETLNPASAQAAAEVLTALCAAAAVRVLALEEPLICETIELLLWINEWPMPAFNHKATNALFW